MFEPDPGTIFRSYGASAGIGQKGGFPKDLSALSEQKRSSIFNSQSSFFNQQFPLTISFIVLN